MWQEHFAAGGITTAFQRRQHHAGEVDKAHAGTAIAPFATDGGFDTTNRCIVVSVLRFNTEFNKFRDDDFVVVERRHPEAAADHLNTGVEEIVTHTRMVTHAEVRLSRTQATARFEDRIREWIYRVHRLTINQILPANSDVLIQRTSRRGF